MTTAQFMRVHFQFPSDTRHCSSVFNDRDGNIYSYGWHYPLLFTISGLSFRNVIGYSSSTGRHIAWASGLADYDIEWPRGYRFSDFRDDHARLKYAKEALYGDIMRRTVEVLKHRDGTSIQRYRVDILNRRKDALRAVQAKLDELTQVTNKKEETINA